VSADGTHYESVISFFDHVYRQYERYWWRRPTRYSTDPADHAKSLITSTLLQTLKGRKPGRALDVGAGEGSDAIRLALLGYEVDAIEGSAIGAEKTEQFARKVGVRLNIQNVDANLFKPLTCYDVIICNGLLHYIQDKPTLVEKLQDATAPDGYNAVSLWSDHTPVPECHRVVDTYAEAEDGVVTSLYKDWSTVGSWREHNKPESGHPGFGPHHHSFIKFIAKKQT
jgi:SAM-dependent methyltransferase